MPDLVSDPDIIIVDRGVGIGRTKINYRKLPYDEEMWDRIGSTPWTRKNLNQATGQEGDPPLSKGHYDISMRPGEVYEVGVFPLDHGPTTLDPEFLARLKVFCLLEDPAPEGLIIDTNEEVGGTFYWNRILTAQPTNVAEIGVSELAPIFDWRGLPRLVNRQDPISSSLFTTDHRSEFTPLFAGTHYFFVAIIVDAFGNWDQQVKQLDTLRRTVTIDFPEVIVNNDGDETKHGNAEFWFSVFEGKDVVKEFNRPTDNDVDDWGGHGRPYLLANPDGSPFRHVIGPQSGFKARESISVYTHGTEYDDWPEADEYAKMPFKRSLPIPHGRFAEVVSNQVLWFRCSTGGTNDFDFSAKVVFSVSYSP